MVSIMTLSREWTLSEAARLLGEPQHRLIYLCEKKVVVPDLNNARGRGSSRLFSSRNLLEFAVALRLRGLELPVRLVAAIIHVLRAFERNVSQEIKGFSLAHSLKEKMAPDLRIILSDGKRLYFSLGVGSGKPKLYGGVVIPPSLSSKSLAGFLQRVRVTSEDTHRKIGNSKPAATDKFGEPEGSKHTRIEVSVTRISKELQLEG